MSISKTDVEVLKQEVAKEIFREGSPLIVNLEKVAAGLLLINNAYSNVSIKTSPLRTVLPDTGENFLIEPWERTMQVDNNGVEATREDIAVVFGSGFVCRAAKGSQLTIALEGEKTYSIRSYDGTKPSTDAVKIRTINKSMLNSL